MKRAFLLIIVGAFVLVLLAFSSLFSVRFNEKAVKTTFGAAGQDNLIEEAGLYFKWPYPVQSVTKYDTRTRFVSSPGEQKATADDAQIIIEPFALWQVRDPLMFYRRFSNAGGRAEDHYADAEKTVQAALRSAINVTSQYRLDDLFTDAAEGSKLPELEGEILNAMQSEFPENPDAGNATDFGLKIVSVGIRRVRLTESNTENIITRMRADRERIAQGTLSEGESLAQTIETRAEQDAARILAFANRLAGEIEARGQREAGEYIAQMDEAPELAVFLSKLEVLNRMYNRQTTVVLPGIPPGSDLLSPNALDGLREGQFPQDVQTRRVNDADEAYYDFVNARDGEGDE